MQPVQGPPPSCSYERQLGASCRPLQPATESEDRDSLDHLCRVFAPKKPSPSIPSPAESEQVSHVSPLPVDLAATSHLPVSSHSLKDPPAASGTQRASPGVAAAPRSKLRSFY